MTLYFVTGNKNKFREASEIISGLEQVKLDLPEIQESDPRKVIEEKLNSACSELNGRFFVEDISLHLDCMNGLPGPFIKWFIKHGGARHLYDLTQAFGNDVAEARCTIGLYDLGKIEFFEGLVKGKIVEPRGESGFGFDPVFLPEGFDQTYAQMPKELKNKISHRAKALEKLGLYLNK